MRGHRSAARLAAYLIDALDPDERQDLDDQIAASPALAADLKRVRQRLTRAEADELTPDLTKAG